MSSKSKKPTTARPSTDRAESLMLVALDLFAQRDFSTTTIKDIANAAAVNTALIYYYFESKEDLFRATIEYAAGRALENYNELRARSSEPVDLIEDWFDNNLALAGSIRKLVKIMLDYSSGVPRLPSVDAVIAQFYAEEMSILSGGIRKGIAQGIFNKVDAAEIALFASVHLDGIMATSIIRRDFDIAAAIEALKRLLWGHLGYRQGNVARTGRRTAAAGKAR